MQELSVLARLQQRRRVAPSTAVRVDARTGGCSRRIRRARRPCARARNVRSTQCAPRSLGSDHCPHQWAAGVVDGGIGPLGHQIPNPLRPGRILIVHHPGAQRFGKVPRAIRRGADHLHAVGDRGLGDQSTHGARYSLHENRCTAGRIGEIDRQGRGHKVERQRGRLCRVECVRDRHQASGWRRRVGSCSHPFAPDTRSRVCPAASPFARRRHLRFRARRRSRSRGRSRAAAAGGSRLRAPSHRWTRPMRGSPAPWSFDESGPAA